MLILIILLILLFGGGGGYYGHRRWGYGGGAVVGYSGEYWGLCLFCLGSNVTLLGDGWQRRLRSGLRSRAALHRLWGFLPR
jgi:hypothetical protein